MDITGHSRIGAPSPLNSEPAQLKTSASTSSEAASASATLALNPAQKSLDELIEKIIALSQGSQKETISYLKTWADIVDCLPNAEDDEAPAQAADNLQSAQKAARETRQKLSLLLVEEKKQRQQFSDTNTDFFSKIQEPAEALHEIANNAISVLQAQENQSQKWQEGLQHTAAFDNLLTSVKRAANNENSPHHESFKKLVDGFDKVQTLLAAQADDRSSDAPHQAAHNGHIQELEVIRDQVKAQLENNKAPINKAEENLLSQCLIRFDEQIALVKTRENELADYRSPRSAAGIFRGRIVDIHAALMVIDQLAAKDPTSQALSTAAELLKSQLKTRLETMTSPIARNMITDKSIETLMGRPIMRIKEQRANPTEAQDQLDKRLELINNVNHIVTTQFVHPLVTEPDLMQGLIERYVVSQLPDPKPDVAGLLKDARPRALNEGLNWAPIHSRFTVPVEVTSVRRHDSAGAVFNKTIGDAVALETITTPIGNIFAGDTVKVMSTGSAISAGDFDDYRVDNPAKPKEKIIAGRNSHCATEGKHAVNLAKSVCNFFGRMILNVTRHATLSPYQFSRTSLKKMSDAEAEKLVAHLGRPAINITRIAINQAPNSAENDTSCDVQPVDTELIAAIMASKSTDNIPITKVDAENIAADTTALLKLARTDLAVCGALRRKAALNRAREIFLSEVSSKPAILERIQMGKTLHFNSISLLTPDPLRAFLSRFSLVKPSDNERRMLADQNRAWADLQAEIYSGGIEINGVSIKANISAMNVDVNPLSLIGVGTLSKALTSGWEYTDTQNQTAIEAMIGTIEDVQKGKIGGRLEMELDDKKSAIARLHIQKNQIEQAGDDKLSQQLSIIQQRIPDLDREVRAMTTLAKQIAEIWRSESYQSAGNEPYKLATRLAMLSSMMGEMTAFNCKSGKDRTAQCDIELKFLAFQIFTNDGKVPEPDRERSDIERRQLSAFIFKDESRRQMQVYNTGFGGSKLETFLALFRNFTLKEEQASQVATQFKGMSGEVET